MSIHHTTKVSFYDMSFFIHLIYIALFSQNMISKKNMYHGKLPHHA